MWTYVINFIKFSLLKINILSIYPVYYVFN